MMDDDDDHLWNFSSLPPLPMDHLLNPPLPIDEGFLQPPLPPSSSSSHQQPFTGELQVDCVGEDDKDKEEASGGDVADGAGEVPDSDNEEEELEDEEPSYKRIKYSGQDSPAVEFHDDSPGTLEDIASSSQSSDFPMHHHVFRNLNISFNNNDNYDSIISEFGKSDDEHDDIAIKMENDDDDIVIKMERMSEDGSSEQENNEIEGNDDEIEGHENDYLFGGGDDMNSLASSQKDFTQDSVQQHGEDMEVVDEVKDSTGANIQGEENEDGEVEDWDYDSDEIDTMLEEGLTDGLQAPKRKRTDVDNVQSLKGGGGEAKTEELPDGVIGVINKSFLKGMRRRVMNLLPPGWIALVHDCGMPVYLHRPTRVVTWSKPYLLGAGSARHHKVPLSSIPCMQYKKEKEGGPKQPNDVGAKQSNNQECQPVESVTASSSEDKENKLDSNTRQTEMHESSQTYGANEQNAAETKENRKETENSEVAGGNGTSATDTQKTLDIGKAVDKHIHVCNDESIGTEELKQYLQRIFEFETIQVKRYKSWSDRRHVKKMKHKERPERPKFPTGPTLITCKVPVNVGTVRGRKEIEINALNKTPVCILHEYSQRVLRTVPSYTYSQSNNANTPFEACIEIDGNKYGSGQAKSKKLAKYEAARATLRILMPDLDKLTSVKGQINNLEYFDHVPINDSRVFELCERTGLLTPWQLLQEYHQRNHGMTNMELNFEVKINKHQKSDYTITYGPHIATGRCKNKKIGKQEGAQKILVKLHPHLSTWGAIIKLYGTRGMSSINLEKKELKQSVVELQGKASHKPNERILKKLKSEMKRLYLKNTEQMITEEPTPTEEPTADSQTEMSTDVQQQHISTSSS